MKIGIISYVYPPEPAVIPGSLAEELAIRGHEVRVLTGYPMHPHGRVYPGYRQRWSEKTTAAGVRVRRVPRYPGRTGSPLRSVASQLSFAASTALTTPGYLTGVDVLYVYHPPATAYTAAGLLHLLRQVPVVLHVQDLWPDAVTASATMPDGRTSRLVHDGLAAAMRRIYRSAAAIVVIAPTMRDLVIERGADPDRVRVVLNWTDERIFRPVRPTRQARAAIGYRNRCTVLYEGDPGTSQRIETAIRAAAATPQVDLVLAGVDAEEEHGRQLAEQLRAGNIRFVGQQPPERMAELYGAVDYQLIMLRDLPVMRGMVPARLQAALSCGSPVVASAGGDTADLVERARVGLSCPPEDWSSLADRFALAAVIPQEARAGMAQRARESYLRRMSMRSGVDQIEQILQEAAVRQPSVVAVDLRR